MKADTMTQEQVAYSVEQDFYYLVSHIRRVGKLPAKYLSLETLEGLYLAELEPGVWVPKADLPIFTSGKREVIVATRSGKDYGYRLAKPAPGSSDVGWYAFAVGGVRYLFDTFAEAFADAQNKAELCEQRADTKSREEQIEAIFERSTADAES